MHPVNVSLAWEGEMNARGFLVALIVLMFLNGNQASFACDPNENCSKCLVSVFGKCKVRGNDPQCEARKLICRRAGPVADLPGMPTGPGGPLAPGGPVPVTPQDLNRCLADVQRCPAYILGRVSYQSIKPIVDGYIGFLMGQGNGRWRSIDPRLANAVSSNYRINPGQVRYATGINTLHGDAITIGNNIFFPGALDLDTRGDQELLFHELEHVVQYQNRGGTEPFLAEYVMKSVGQVASRRSFNVHDYIDIERAAISKASSVIRNEYGWEFLFENQCSQPIDLALHYLDPVDGWSTEGYWRMNSGERSFLADTSGSHLRSKNRVYYYYAEIVGSSYSWSGDVKKVVDADDRELGFRTVEEYPNGNEFRRTFTCTNYHP
jgi:uncharacterized membrane protein